MSREPGSIPVTCDICGVAVVVGADTPDTNLRRLGWDSTGEDDLCPMCKPRSLRALLMDVLGINVTGRYLDQAIVREVRALKLASEELSKQRIPPGKSLWLAPHYRLTAEDEGWPGWPGFDCWADEE